MSQGLPKSHCRMAQSDAIILDYPHAIFGYTEKNAAYRSRVDFGALHLQGVAKELTGIQTVLGEPKPSFYPGYVQGGKNYNEDDFQLRGYKLYWLKKTAKAAEPSNQNENVGTIMYPLDQGSTFGGVIRYRNLTPDELGLLLWWNGKTLWIWTHESYHRSIGGMGLQHDVYCHRVDRSNDRAQMSG